VILLAVLLASGIGVLLVALSVLLAGLA